MYDPQPTLYARPLLQFFSIQSFQPATAEFHAVTLIGIKGALSSAFQVITEYVYKLLEDEVKLKRHFVPVRHNYQIINFNVGIVSKEPFAPTKV